MLSIVGLTSPVNFLRGFWLLPCLDAPTVLDPGTVDHSSWILNHRVKILRILLRTSPKRRRSDPCSDRRKTSPQKARLCCRLFCRALCCGSFVTVCRKVLLYWKQDCQTSLCSFYWMKRSQFCRNRIRNSCLTRSEIQT